MKKAIILLVVLCLAFQFGACSKSSSKEPAADTYAQQKELIDSLRSTWSMDGDWSPWFYTITDLDHNGRYELVAATVQGTGLYTYANYYEVNADISSVSLLPKDMAEGDSWPDVVVDSAPCYIDKQSGRHYYIYEDTVKDGAAAYYFSTDAVCLHDGTVERVHLASKTVTYTDGKPQTACSDASGSPISEEQYSQCAADHFKGCEASTASFSWERVDSDPPREPSLIFAQDLYEGCGFVHTRCDETGVYDFAPISSEGITWEVYILDNEFNDAERFIPQAYSCALRGGGSLSIKEGEWIYIYCPCNMWTAEEAPEGCAFSWGINPAKKYGDAPLPPEYGVHEDPSDIVITKNPASEALSVGGKTWFIAFAENGELAEWVFTDPEGISHSIGETASMNPPLVLEVLDGSTLAVNNVPLSLDGWKVQARFQNDHSSASTESATIYVKDFVSAYSKVLNAYKAAAASGDKSFETAEKYDISEYYSYSDQLGYSLKDLDKNGVPELIIAGTGANDYSDRVICEIYTLDGDTPVLLCRSSARDRYYLLSDSRIFNEGSGGAAYSVFNLFKADGSNLKFVEGYATYNGIEEPGSAIYVTDTLGSDGYPDFSAFHTRLTLDEGMKTIESIQSMKWVPDLTPFT